MQGTRVLPLVREDSTRPGETAPVGLEPVLYKRSRRAFSSPKRVGRKQTRDNNERTVPARTVFISGRSRQDSEPHRGRALQRTPPKQLNRNVPVMSLWCAQEKPEETARSKGRPGNPLLNSSPGSSVKPEGKPDPEAGSRRPAHYGGRRGSHSGARLRAAAAKPHQSAARYRMAALFLKKLTLQTIKTENCCIRRCLSKYILQGPASPRPPRLIHAKAFSTEDTQDESTKKKKNETAFSSVGRKINERIIHVLDEQGNDLGHMHRANVIRLMTERDLRLVKRDASAEPPQYQLLTGAQIHQERLRLREAERAAPKPGPTLTKELTFSSNIGQHDLNTKSKQIQQWIEKKYKVQITVKKGKSADEPEDKMEEMCNRIVQAVSGIATFSSRPQPIRGGKAVMCVLRPLSKKEEAAWRAAPGTPRGDALNTGDGKDGASGVLPH
ncbi:hypothetical protein MJG53_009882 [Ovis ammon polii x Ovis aries]|uniref:Uncharacterized protein n=1 Tax=Ovis ammon polii x Ovis aries TaxID=2918886 RepID=A0ACB9UVQ2_9CETA|nr:hypothetical protein MJG53_009882 [Ovis ammon polii x Ovis aries]